MSISNLAEVEDPGGESLCVTDIRYKRVSDDGAHVLQFRCVVEAPDGAKVLVWRDVPKAD